MHPPLINHSGTRSSRQRILAMRATEDLPPQDMRAPGPTAAEMRETAIREADPIGSLNDQPDAEPPHKLLDLLGGRLAFERGGVRLYDALLRKAQVLAIRQRAFDLVEPLQRIREQEAEHALLLQQMILRHGGDPTMETPCADIEGVMSAGILNVVHDPRTTLVQCLNAALVAELADVEHWTSLVRIANGVVDDRDSTLLAYALETEQDHVSILRDLALQLEEAEMQAYDESIVSSLR